MSIIGIALAVVVAIIALKALGVILAVVLMLLAFLGDLALVSLFCTPQQSPKERAADRRFSYWVGGILFGVTGALVLYIFLIDPLVRRLSQVG